jgi:hypothetical protein
MRSTACVVSCRAVLWCAVPCCGPHRSDVVQIKIGRRGATPSLISAVQAAWRSSEVVKLRIHDDKVGAVQLDLSGVDVCRGGSKGQILLGISDNKVCSQTG